MQYKFFLFVIVLFLLSCSKQPSLSVAVDQNLRHKLFCECLRLAPAGPVSTKYNDWSEVIDECSSYAYYAAKRTAASDSITEGVLNGTAADNFLEPAISHNGQSPADNK